MTAGRWQILASGSLLALIFLCLVWELWLAPLRPDGSWLVLKAVFLLAPLFGILHGKRYTYRWSVLFVLAYLAEGLVRAGDSGLTRSLAIAEVVLVALFFISAIAYLRSTRQPTAGPR